MRLIIQQISYITLFLWLLSIRKTNTVLHISKKVSVPFTSYEKSKMNVLSISKYICVVVYMLVVTYTHANLIRRIYHMGPLVNLSSGCQKYWLFSQNQTSENKLSSIQQITTKQQNILCCIFCRFVYTFTLLIIGFLIAG